MTEQNNVSPSLSNHLISLRQVASWRLPNLRPESLDYPIAGIPSLQRGLVWKPSKTELLWDSVLRGFPIGAFVLCRKLQSQQQRRLDEDATYDLLDGQQRAHAIELGFEQPFEGNERETAPILWIDLGRPTPKETKAFPLRVTTKAHPWGYEADDAASPLALWRIRETLKTVGRMTDDDRLRHDSGELPKRPLPKNLWPAVAEAPVPFAWLMACTEKNPEAFWAAVRSRCHEAVRVGMPRQMWAGKAAEILDQPAAWDRKELHAIWQGVKRAHEARVVLLEVRDDALMSASAQEDSRPTSRGGDAEITNVEHLFYRLNALGTRLEGDELAYSMVKAHWPELEAPIRRLARRKLPEARLVTLAARVPLTTAKRHTDAQHRKITTAVSVSEFRRLAQAGMREEQDQTKDQRKAVLTFFMDGQPNLAAVLDQVESWLELGADGIGLPPVLQTSIARNSRDVYALLLWLAARSLQEESGGGTGTSGLELRKPVLGLATALHWFAADQGRAVGAIGAAIDGKPLCPDLFQGLLAKAFEVDGRSALYRPLRTGDLDKLIVLPDSSSLGHWRWDALTWNGGTETDQITRQFLWRVRSERELLLYAQRAYIGRRFDYDPARQDTWEQHNRPWDFDHILPSSKTYYRHKEGVPYKSVLNEWINCIGNLRACPMEENRSDQHVAPEKKLTTHEELTDAFLLSPWEMSDAKGFQRGYDGIDSPDGVMAFLNAVKRRLIRIYGEWHDGLDIHTLTQGAFVGAPRVTNDWSDDLKAQTRDVIEGRDILASRDGQLHLKHLASGFGTIAEDDLRSGVLRVVDRQTGAETSFASADELIAAGWTLD